SNFTQGHIVQFTCDPGYVLKGANQAECSSTGKWSANPPNCQEITCPELPNPMNAERTQPNLRVGSKAIYKCNVGYKLQGIASITCVEREEGTGAWSDLPPICVLFTCPPLRAPAHGRIQNSVFTYGQQVRFSCDPGYNLRGLAALTCGTGEWDAAPPVCESKLYSEICYHGLYSVLTVVQCPAPTLNDNIVVQPEHQQASVYNSILTFSCEAGYKLKGYTTIRCLANGRWDDRVPSCEGVY
ncbi:hypothetical protein CAPTEDRAFT_126262, partial [Capitella teleta]